MLKCTSNKYIHGFFFLLESVDGISGKTDSIVSIVVVVLGRGLLDRVQFLVDGPPFDDPETERASKGQDSNNYQLDVKTNVAAVQETGRRCHRLQMLNKKELRSRQLP